ncbi:hypothetical protein BOX15_Mlig011056g1 [Macrostomum lignano]|uniref:Uncharacterized protein n=1 Tax=Macrostomum lignano TaxID=282301 RepID=A0A267GJW4_9PLAT|nr:hypothetical protein BOX15_Mlig011056g1 [Macrostomum lignano]
MREALPPARRQPVPATTVAPVAPVAGACFTGTGSYRQFQPKVAQPVYPAQTASLLLVKRQPSSAHSSRGPVATLSTKYSYNYHSESHRGGSNCPLANVLGSLCCGIRWSEAGRFYLLIGGILCGVGIVTLLATGFGHHGPVWIGPIIVCAGVILIGKGAFDYVRHRVKASAERPDSIEGDAVASDGARRQRRRMRLVGALPFGAASAERRRRKQLAANLRYIHGAGATGSGNTAASWATDYSQQGSLRPPPRELVQNASLLLSGGSPAAYKQRQIDSSAMLLTGGSMASSLTSGPPREPVYFPVMSSTDRLPTPQETPFPSVFSLQAVAAPSNAAATAAGARDRLLSTRRSSGASAPSIFHTLRASPSAASSATRGGVVGRSRTRLPLMPSKGAARLTSHKEEV